MDADLEYDPASLGELVPPLLAGEAEAVYGVRGFQSHSAFSFWYVLGNKFVTLVANFLYNRWLADIMTCHKIMRTDCSGRSPCARTASRSSRRSRRGCCARRAGSTRCRSPTAPGAGGGQEAHVD